MSNTTAKKQMEQVFALWKRKSKDGKTTFFSGKYGEKFLTAFYNTDKKNMKEPDMRVYIQDDNGELSKEVFVSLWCNATKDGKKKYLSGKINGKRVVGFIKADATEKQPYISVFWSDDEQKPKQEKKAKKEAPQMEEVGEEDLPF